MLNWFRFLNFQHFFCIHFYSQTSNQSNAKSEFVASTVHNLCAKFIIIVFNNFQGFGPNLIFPFKIFFSGWNDNPSLKQSAIFRNKINLKTHIHVWSFLQFSFFFAAPTSRYFQFYEQWQFVAASLFRCFESSHRRDLRPSTNISYIIITNLTTTTQNIFSDWRQSQSRTLRTPQ